MNKLAITISGKAGHGKDTFAEIAIAVLKEKGIRARRLAFADYLKQEAQLLGWTGEKDAKGRTLLQNLSSLTKTYHGLDYYVKKVQKNIELLDYDVFFITDTRHPYEVRPIKNTVAVRIERPGYDNGLTKSQQKHISEVELDDYEGFDHYVINLGEREHLKEQIEIILEDILKDSL